MKRFAGTAKQQEIVNQVLDAMDAGVEIEFHALRGKLSYGMSVTKQALQSSIRYLEEHGFISRKYGHARKLYLLPTMLAYQVFRPAPSTMLDPEDPEPHS